MNRVNYGKNTCTIVRSRLFRFLGKATGYAAFILCSVGICLLDSPNPVLTELFLWSGVLTAVFCFICRKLFIYFRKAERNQYLAALKKEARNRIVFSGEYTKIA